MAQPKNKRLSAAAKKAKPKNRYQEGGFLDQDAVERAKYAIEGGEQALRARSAAYKQSPTAENFGAAVGEGYRSLTAPVVGGLDVVGGTANKVLLAPARATGRFLQGAYEGLTGAEPAIQRRAAPAAAPAASRLASAAPKATPTAPAAPARQTGRPAPQVTADMQPMTDWQRNYETGGASAQGPAQLPAAVRMLMEGQGGQGGPSNLERYQNAISDYRSMRGEGEAAMTPQALYAEAQRLYELGSNPGTDYQSQVQAAIARNRAKTLMGVVEKSLGEQGATGRTAMQERGENRRTSAREAGSDRRTASQILGELQKAETTAQYNAALKKMEGEISRGNKQFEILTKEGLPSTQAGIAKDTALSDKYAAEGTRAAIAAQLEEIIADPSSPAASVAFAQSVLPQLTGRFTPMAQERAKAIGKTATPQFATPAQQLQAQAMLEAERRGLGYAEGGAVNRMQPPAAPTMGMPNIQPQVQLVNDYRAYSTAATKLGATPVPFDQFASMKQARSMQGYAMGGAVQPMGQPMMPDVSMGYKDGGAIPVAGKQVLGPGDGKSDSIPAIIDGKTKAALSTGEFVFPIEAVQHYGLDRLNKMVEKARTSPSA